MACLVPAAAEAELYPHFRYVSDHAETTGRFTGDTVSAFTLMVRPNATCQWQSRTLSFLRLHLSFQLPLVPKNHSPAPMQLRSFGL